MQRSRKYNAKGEQNAVNRSRLRNDTDGIISRQGY